MVYGDAGDRFAGLKRSPEDYTVFDTHYERLGKVGDIFVVADDRLAYIGISQGLLDLNLTPVPVEIIRVNDKRRVVVVEDSRDKLERAPTLKTEEEINPELEARIRSYFGLEPERSPILEHNPTEPREAVIEDERVDTIPGERKAAEDMESGAMRDPNLPPKVRRLGR